MKCNENIRLPFDAQTYILSHVTHIILDFFQCETEAIKNRSQDILEVIMRKLESCAQLNVTEVRFVDRKINYLLYTPHYNKKKLHFTFSIYIV
jgi:hypothetical protein